MRQIKSARLISVAPIVTFSLIIFLIALADAIMSYYTPVILDKALKDTAVVGMVISISSFFGMFLDIYAAERLSNKNFRFFIIRAFIFAAGFPLIMLFLPHKLLYFAVAMVVWSVYYEFIGYSKYNFVHKFTATHDHTNAWGTLATFGALAYMLGPGIAAYLIARGEKLPLFAALILVGFSFLLYFSFTKKAAIRNNSAVPTENVKNIFKEFSLFKTLSKRLWILLFFIFIITLIDVSMWTIGVLYANELRKTSDLGGWFMVIYGVPAIFIGIIANKVNGEMGKKRTAFTCAAIAGFCLIYMGFSHNIVSILVFVFLMSLFFGVSSVLMDATFQDYISRVEGVGNDIVSMLQFVINLSYVLGPIILGLFSKYFGFTRTFQLVGALVVLAALLAFIVTPRKLRIPQKEIAEDLWIKHDR